MSLRHWKNYYRDGALASCPLGPGSGYTQELRDIWVEFFSGLPEDARILDIGTGNGAVALIALESAASAGRHYEIHGTDLAQIDRALGEIHRVLKPGGRALFILHHAESIVARKARQTLQQSALVLEETKILRKLRRHLEAERRSHTAALVLEADRFEGNIRASVRRLQDLLRCGQSEAGMGSISKLARAQGFHVREMALQYHSGTALVGWRLRLAKP